MVVDYREAHQAIAAQKLLAGAGIIAVYIPDKVVRVSEDAAQTVWLVQRLKTPRADAASGGASEGPRPAGEPLGTEWN